MIFAKQDLSDILSIALKNGADFSEIYLENRVSSAVTMEEGRIERMISGIDAGAGIRVIKGETTGYVYTNNLTKEGLGKAAELAAQVVKGDAATRQISLVTKNNPLDFNIKVKPDAVKAEQKAALLFEANSTVRECDQRVRQATITYRDTDQQVIIANSDGNYVEDERIRTNFVVNVVVADGEKIQTGYESLGGLIGFEVFEKTRPQEIAIKATKRALAMLEAPLAPTGKMPVILAGKAGGTMVHEACGHGLEADLAMKGLSVYGGKIGERVAAEGVTVVDDGTIGNYFGSLRFDDEGNSTKRNVLIENGVLKGYMHDRLTAKKLNVEPTGNGRRESYHHKPIPRMTNTFIEKGDAKPEEMLRNVKNGLYVTKMGGGQVNTTNGDFVFEVSEGYLIENGEIKNLVRGATLTGNGPEVLNEVEMVGNDVGFTIGICGKDGQGVPVTDGQPSLAIKNLIVGGQ